MEMDSRASRRLVSTLALVAVVLAVRVLYFVPIANGPLARLHLWEESDMHFA
jgi:hypothetical protein